MAAADFAVSPPSRPQVAANTTDPENSGIRDKFGVDFPGDIGALPRIVQHLQPSRSLLGGEVKMFDAGGVGEHEVARPNVSDVVVKGKMRVVPEHDHQG